MTGKRITSGARQRTIFSVVKRMFGDDVMSRCIVTQNREMIYRMIAYNCYRVTRDYVLILYGFYRANWYESSTRCTWPFGIV